MWVNPGVDSYTKTLNHRKILRKTQKTTLLKNKKILKPKYELSGGPIFTFSLPGGVIRPSALWKLPQGFSNYKCNFAVPKQIGLTNQI